MKGESLYGMQSRVLTGHNTMRRHLYIMGLIVVPFVGGVGQRRKPQFMFCVNMQPWQHSDIRIWVPFSWTLRMLEV